MKFEFSGTSKQPSDHFSEGSNMSKRIHSMDWSKTALGDRNKWPQSLKSSVSLCINSPFPLLIWWGDEFIKIYNDAYRKILGSKHPALGARGRDVWPEIWPIVGPMLKSVLKEGKSTWAENQLLLITRDGYPEECYFTFSFSPIYDESGGIGGVFTAVTETTKQVISQRHLTTLKDLGANIRGSQSGLDVYQSVNRVLKKNEKDFPFALIYKIDQGANIANRIALCRLSTGHKMAPSVIVIPDDDLWNLSSVVKKNSHTVITLKGKTADLPGGAWDRPPDKALIMPVGKSNGGYPDAVIIIGLNPHHLADKKYIAFFKLLVDQVGSEISNIRSYEKVRRQATALAEIDKAKTAFFANISHELRTPLTLILGPMEDIIFRKDVQLSEVCWENIGVTYRNAKKLKKLVNMLLDFSSIEAGRMQAKFRPINISNFTRDLANNFRSTIENVGLHYEVKCEEINLPVYIDKVMWEKVVYNLLSNAFKFTLKGKIQLSLTEVNGHVRLRVEDTGVGIAEKELAHIFERFHRVQKITGRSFEGTGIGLALVKEMVNLHHGTITVASMEGKGSRFEVDLLPGSAHLPQEQVIDDPDPEEYSDIDIDLMNTQEALFEEIRKDRVNERSEKRHVKNKSTRILVVDDNSDMREYLSRLLSKYYDIETAADGKEALERIETRQPDLIVSDIMMPEINGLQFLEILKDNRDTALIPVILLSARAGEEAKIKGYDTGADDYLVKPFSARELLARVRSQLKMLKTRKHYRLQMQNIFSQAYVAICVFRGPDHVIEFANEQMLSYWGRSEEEAINKPALDVFPEVVQQGFRKILDDVYHNGERFVAHEVPIEFHRKGRLETTYIHLVYEPLHEEDGSISGIIAVANEVTELVQSKNIIQKSEKKFRDLIMQSPVAMGVFKGKDMVIDLANDAMLKLWDRQGVDVRGMKQLDLVPELADQKFPQLMEDVYNTGIPYEEEGALARIKTEEGLVDHYLNYLYTPLFEPDGIKVSGLVATVVDVTEQIQAKKEVEESENRYRQLIQGLPTPLYTSDPDGRILLYNKAAADLWGRKPVLNKDMWCGSWRIYDPNGTHVPLDQHPMAITLKEQRPMSGELIIERPDGVKRYVQANAEPIFDADGKLTGAINMLIDITEDKRAENVLRESEERFRKVADTAPAMIWMTDANRSTYFFNTAWLKFTGRTLDDEKDRGWEAGVHPDDLPHCLRVSGKAFDAREAYTVEYRLKRYDGQYRWLSERAVPRFTADDVFEGYIGSCMDIQDKKTASDVLELRVDARTKELKRANEELEKMNQELTSFAYISSHDLQEPLRKIQTFISRIVDLEGVKLSKKGLDYFGRIQNASQRMQQLIEDLLTYSRTNTDERNLQSTDLNKLVEDVKNELQEKITEKDAIVEVAQLPTINVVEFQFHQLFTNLISNALKFSGKEGVPHIVVRAATVRGDDVDVKGIDKDQTYHYISVSDNGIGFDQQYNERIFELFQRLHGRTEYRGTGIGLAICKKIVENHEGILAAEGESGKGATFKIYLPVD